MTQLNSLEKKINEKLSEKKLIQAQLSTLQGDLKKTKVLLFQKEKSLEIVKQVALKTQNQLQFHLSDMVSAGLNSVFDEEYDFKILFEIKRGKTECRLFFEKNGHLVDPLNFSGLGEADIAAFCLRCASWSMSKEYRNLLILDEPFKHLSVNYHEKAGAMVKLLSKQLNLQIIMVTHSKEFTKYADRVFNVTKTNNNSNVNQTN